MTKVGPEVWKDIPGYANYAVSDRGNVKNTYTERLLHIHQSHYRTKGVTLHKGDGGKWWSIKELMAMAFLEDYDPDKEVRYRFPSRVVTLNALDNIYMGPLKKHIQEVERAQKV